MPFPFNALLSYHTGSLPKLQFHHAAAGWYPPLRYRQKNNGCSCCSFSARWETVSARPCTCSEKSAAPAKPPRRNAPAAMTEAPTNRASPCVRAIDPKPFPPRQFFAIGVSNLLQKPCSAANVRNRCASGQMRRFEPLFYPRSLLFPRISPGSLRKRANALFVVSEIFMLTSHFCYAIFDMQSNS